MQTREPESSQQIDDIQRPAHERMDEDTPARPALWSGWRGPLIGGLIAVIVVFAVIDIGHVLFPLRNLTATRPLIIQVQNSNGDTSSTAVPAALTASPQSLALGCGQTATVTLTNTASYSIHWTLDMPSDGVILSANSPHSGGLAPGEQATLQVVSLGRSINAALHFSEDRGSTLDVPVRVAC